MRCHICNAVLTVPNPNADHGDFDPCESCLVVINDLVAGFGDQASAEEDEFSEPDLRLLFYPEAYVPPDPDEEEA